MRRVSWAMGCTEGNNVGRRGMRVALEEEDIGG